MTEGKRIHDFTELLLWQDDAEMRLTQAHDDHPLAWALVMAALSWDQVNRRGWRAPAVLCAQARRVMARQGISTEPVDDADQVASALEWTTQDPALLECDGQGHYRPVYGVVLPVGSGLWHEQHRAALASGVLTPLELVIKGDADCGANPDDPDAPEVSYRLAMDGDDPDAAAVASLRLAELAEERDQPVEAARRYAEVAELRHPLASPPAVLWLARQAAQNGDRPAARILAHEVVDSGAGSLVPAAWGLLGSLAWLDNDKDEAVAAVRQAVHTAGEWHWSYSRQLAEMLAKCGDLAGAAEGYRTLLDQPLLSGPDAGRYVQLMTAAGRGDEAVAVLAQHPAQDGPFAADILLALASAHAVRDELDACRQVLARVRSHWSAVLPQVSVRADVMEASVAAADGDDARAAQLFRSLTDTDDTERRNLARPLLIASGDQYAAEGKLCLIPGVRPLLEYLSEVAPPATATWAATSLAHLATVEGRSGDAEAAVRLAARTLSLEEVTVLRALLLCRADRERDALAYLVDACATATPQAMATLLPTLTGWRTRGLWLDREQRLRLRAAVDHVLFDGDDHGDGDGEGVRERVAAAMAQVELHSCFSSARAAELWEIAAHGDDSVVAALAWLNLGVMRRWSNPIDAAAAFEHAMQLGEGVVGTRAAMELAELADRIGDDAVQARACQRALEVASGDDWAQAALRLGRINQYQHPDDAEDAYHAAIAEPGARPATIGAALARLGALYAMHGNRRLAQRFWRRGKRHRDPDVAEAFAAERAGIGRVMRLRAYRRLP
ncbi:MAG TPA: hypothetical protein VHH34_22625 [Pseudonocardiaceae bacterium]|nr:hypothetical protein [Pseudonocardiaceae bacterium]